MITASAAFIARSRALRILLVILPAVKGGSVSAQPVPESPPLPAHSDAETDETILVVAKPSERSSIDRSTYLVRDNAEARISNALDLLTHVPFVDVTSAGRVRLMGNPGVKILIDGKEVSDPAVMLRNLQGSQVSKIEIISNPSAQFSAQGTAGIINIVTRRSFASGLGGSATASGGSFGAYDLRISPTWSHGPLSISGSLSLAHSALPIRFDRDRASRDGENEATQEFLEHGSTRTRGDNVAGNILLSYKLAAKQTVSLTAFALRSDQNITGESDIISGEQLSEAFHQTSTAPISVNANDFSVEYQRDGRKEGERLTVSLKSSRRRVKLRNDFLLISPDQETSTFAIQSNNIYSLTTLKLDYVLPFNKTRRLSFGGSIQRTHTDLLMQQAGQITPSGGLLESSFEEDGSWLEKNAYVTYQTSLLGGTLLTGIRFEGRRYHLSNQPVVEPLNRSGMFPSAHFERKVAKRLTANLSYSRRVAWPGITDLDPELRFSDPATAAAGNPALRPEITDSYEARLMLNLRAHSIGLTLFSRRTKDEWADAVELDDSVFVKRPVNLGVRSLRGASISIQGPLARRLRYSLNGDLADQKYELDRAGIDLAGSGPDYGGSAQLEYRDGVEGRRGADSITFNARYRGPTRSILYRSSSSPTADASWSHTFTDRLSAVARISDLFGSNKFRTINLSPSSIAREVNRVPGPRITLSLTYSLNRPSAAP